MTDLEEQLRSLQTPTRPLPTAMPSPMPSLHAARERRRTAWLVAASVVVLVAVAAGAVVWANGTRPQPVATTPGPAGTATITTPRPPTTPGPTRTFTYGAASASSDQLDAAARTVQARLRAYGIDGAAAERRDDVVEITVPVNTDAGVVASLTASGRVEFRPVLWTPTYGTSTGEPPPAGYPAGSAPTTVLDSDQTGFISEDPAFLTPAQTVQVGPAALVGGIERATAEINGQSRRWVVNPIFRPGADGIDAFNEVARRCYVQDASCPTGQLAMVVNGLAISEPRINADHFDADQIEIVGTFTEESARQLAALLGADALPVTLEPR